MLKLDRIDIRHQLSAQTRLQALQAPTTEEQRNLALAQYNQAKSAVARADKGLGALLDRAAPICSRPWVLRGDRRRPPQVRAVVTATVVVAVVAVAAVRMPS